MGRDGFNATGTIVEWEINDKKLAQLTTFTGNYSYIAVRSDITTNIV